MADSRSSGTRLASAPESAGTNGGRQAADPAVQLLTDRFRVVSYNGGEDSPGYGIKRALSDGGVHCSRRGRNFDLVLEYKGHGTNTQGGGAPFMYLTNVVVSGSPACTAPIRDTIVFASQELPKVESYTKQWNDETAEGFSKRASQTSSSKPAEVRPVCFVQTDEKSLEGVAALSPWPKVRFLHLKFIRPHADANIDIDRIHVIGIPGDSPNVPSVSLQRAVGGDKCAQLGALRPRLGTFNMLRVEHMPIIQAETVALLLCSGSNSPKIVQSVRQMAVSEWKDSGLSFFYHCARADETADPTSYGSPDDKAAEFLRSIFVGSDFKGSLFGLREPDGTRYLLPLNTKITPKSVNAFCEAFAAGSLRPHIKSAARPKGDASLLYPGLSIAVGSTLQAQIHESKHRNGVLVALCGGGFLSRFGVPSADTGDQVALSLVGVAQALKSTGMGDEIGFVAMDLEANDAPSETVGGLDISPPAVFWAAGPPRLKKFRPIKPVKGPFTVTKLLKFVAKQGQKPIKLTKKALDMAQIADQEAALRAQACALLKAEYLFGKDSFEDGKDSAARGLYDSLWTGEVKSSTSVLSDKLKAYEAKLIAQGNLVEEEGSSAD